MPEEIQKPAIEMDPAAVAAANAGTITKSEDQTREKPTAEIDLQHTSDALDALAKTVVEEKTEKPIDPPAAVEPTPEEKAAAEVAAKEKADTAKRAEEFFKDSPSLPPNASPKSSEAFSSIKIKAAQEIAARDAKLEETQKKLADAEAKLQNTAPPETLKELEDHRQWRAKLDVDADPKFKEFDKQADAAREFVYSQLAKSPAITPDIIAQIKKLGGPENVNLDKIFTAVQDPTLQRIVESKVADIEMAKFNKEQAIKATKENISKYLEERQKTYEQNVGAHNTRTQEHFSQLTAKLPWFVEKPVDVKADEATRKSVETHNSFVADTRKQLDAALQDDSPEMRAIMLTGMAQLLYLQRVHESVNTRLVTAEKALAEANTKLEKFKNASVGRLREGGGAAPGGKSDIKPKESDIFSKRANESLDDLAKQVMQERARAAAA